MESFEKRLKRYTTQDDLEIFGCMAIMMQNVSLREIRIAQQHDLYQCVFLSTHAIIQTLVEIMFGMKGKDGTKFYLENFVDGATPDRQFSLISDYIHEMRNIIAHQGYSRLQHTVDFDHNMREGWKQLSDIIYINTSIYVEQFSKAFEDGAHVDKYRLMFTSEQRVIRKYAFIRNWLRLPKTDPIAQEIKKLEGCSLPNDVRTQEANVQNIIMTTYNLT